jgi:branched-chain amino acid transport system ATP-binding protein
MMAEAIGIIQAEHRAYAAVLDCLDNLVQDVDTRGCSPDFELFGLILEYIRDFIDRYHHPKEDHYLFKALRRRAPEVSPALEALEDEHKRGPELIRALDWALREYQALGASAYSRFRDAARQYVAFERAHMRREETEIIPLARVRLTAGDWQTIDAVLTENNDPVFGAAPTKRFEKLFSTIVAMAPVPYGLGVRGPRQ